MGFRSGDSSPRRVIFSSFLSFILNSTVRFFIPVLLPFLIVSLNIDLYLGSLLITAYWIGYTFFQIPAGIMGDRFGTARVNKVFFILLAFSFPFIYFLRESYPGLFALQIIIGAISAVIYITDASLVQKWSPMSGRAASVGIYQTGFFVGASLGEFFVLEMFRFSFVLPFVVILAFLVSVSVLNLIYIREPKSTLRKTKGKLSMDIIYVCFIRFSAGFSYIGYLSLFTTFIVFDHITAYSGAYSLAWIPASGGIIGSPIGGYLSAKHSKGKSMVSISSAALIGLSLILLPYVQIFYVLLISSLTGFFYGLYAGPSMSMASDFSGGDRNVSSSSGIINFSSQIGGAISPLIVGFMFSIYGNFDLAFLIMGTITLITLVPPAMKFLLYHKENTLS